MSKKYPVDKALFAPSRWRRVLSPVSTSYTNNRPSGAVIKISPAVAPAAILTCPQNISFVPILKSVFSCVRVAVPTVPVAKLKMLDNPPESILMLLSPVIVLVWRVLKEETAADAGG